MQSTLKPIKKWRNHDIQNMEWMMCGSVTSSSTPENGIYMASNILFSYLKLTTQMWNTIQIIYYGIRAVVNEDISTLIYSA